MSESLQKLRPDRDLQCYFERPSAIAALSQTSGNGFTLSGTFRQQFDWAVVEWNRDNTFEHPSLRYLPDGDLSGVTLTYEEERENCIALDSDLYPTVDWHTLRIWAGEPSSEEIYYVNLKSHAEPIDGAYVCARASLSLSGDVHAGDYVGFELLGQHHTYQAYATDTLSSVASALANSVNAFAPLFRAETDGAKITLIYVGLGPDGLKATEAVSETGLNGNRVGVYTYSTGTSLTWDHSSVSFSGGVSPSRWRVTIDFGDLIDRQGRSIPTSRVRKMRWTYAADLQKSAFERTEFRVTVSSWAVTGTGRQYQVAGPGSFRIEDDAREIEYQGSNWKSGQGNFSGGSIKWTNNPGDQVKLRYWAAGSHDVYLGSRYTAGAAIVCATLDGTASNKLMAIPGEDTLCRVSLGTLDGGWHEVTLAHAGATGQDFYFDFLEVVYPCSTLPVAGPEPVLTAATDWDTDHSLALAPERTAWILTSLGFRARANHYAGAMWFYELVRTGHQYASKTIEFTGGAVPNAVTTLLINRVNEPIANATRIDHLHHAGDTPATIALAFSLELNRGYTAVRAECTGSELKVFARAMGSAGEEITLDVSTNDPSLVIVGGSGPLAGSVNGSWQTDTALDSPALNRAARDWTRSYCAALKDSAIQATVAFSMELQHGSDDIAQKGPDGDPILLPTPAVQTTFSEASRAFWSRVHASMAGIMAESGMQPYLQFGEVQWWYFNSDGLGRSFSGMPYYDSETKQLFETKYGRPLPRIPSNDVNPLSLSSEAQFLSERIGEFTTSVIQHVRSSYPACRFEVLYPTDVNQSAWNQAVNFPLATWKPEILNSLKTENFGFTFNRDVDSAKGTLAFAPQFGNRQRAHLIGIGDSTSSWAREMQCAVRAGLESVVLWALDQFCLIGYKLPLSKGFRRSSRQGS